MLTEWRWLVKIAALAVAVPTTATLVYWLLLRGEDDEDGVSDERQKVETSRQTTIQLTVPRAAVGVVIGAKGANIKKIQQETGARINFNDRDKTDRSEEDRMVTIRGDTESAQKAEVMIRQIVADMPAIVTEEVLVPAYCLGRLIGRGGQNIREMSHSTKCKIFIDRSQDSEGAHVPRTVTITGPQTQIPLAKAMIEEKVEEEETFRATAAVKAANREQRKPEKRTAEGGREKVVLPSRVVEADEDWEAGDSGRLTVPDAAPVSEFMQVFVSAVEHADHFWLQQISSAALNLDKLTDDMNLFYSNPDTAQDYAVKEVKVGDTVAAPFTEDNAWYRAEVQGQEEDKVDLYYFDFGDSGLLPREALRELKPEYLSLPVQAIECKLANVAPVDKEWSEESCEVFEDLSHCAQWKILSARTVGYLPTPTGHRPCVQLIDNAADPPVDIAEEMVARGLAAWETKSSPAPVAMETVSPGPECDPDPTLADL